MRHSPFTMRPIPIVVLTIVLSAALYAQAPSAFETHLTAGQAAVKQSRYAEADTQLHAAVADVDRPDPARSPGRVVEAYSALCDLDLLMSRYDEAIAMAGKAVDMAEPITQPATDLSPHLLRLAGALRAGGKTQMALPVLQRMLTLDQTLGADDPKVSADYDKLGSAYLELSQMEEARDAYRKALDTRISRLGPEDIEVATSWVNLGVMEQRNAKADAAQKDYETALAISEKKLGPDAYGLTGILDRLGRLFSEQKDYHNAELQFQRSLAIREKILGPRHSDVAPAVENLGWVYFFDKKYLEAEPLFQRALQIWIATKEPTNPLIAQALDNLGTLYSAQRRYPEAEPFFRKALFIRETKDLESLSTLAQIYQATNEMKKADEYFQRALLIGEKALGGDHPEVLDVIDEYAVMLRAANRIVEAKKMEAHSKELNDKLAPEKAAARNAANVQATAPVQKH